MYEEDCVFCREIIRKRKAAIIYDDDFTMAFMDNAPVEEGHALVIPKNHFVNVMDINDEEYIKVHMLAKRLSPAIIRATGADALNIGQNNGLCADQRVMHYHLHIIPRWCDRKLDWQRKVVDDSDLEKVAKRIRDSFNDPNGDQDRPILK